MLTRVGPAGDVALDALLRRLNIEVVAMTPEAAESARSAYRRYGKGVGYPAVLNYGDCLTYGVAASMNEPLLYKGNDFHKDGYPEGPAALAEKLRSFRVETRHWLSAVPGRIHSYMNAPVDAAFVLQTLGDLVAINSINPALSDSPTDESQAAAYIVAFGKAHGFDTAMYEFAPGRCSVVLRLRGTGGGRSLMLNGHIDTVGVTGMPSPFEPAVRAGKLFGRGAYDMKGGVTACMAAMKALRDADIRLAGDVVLAAVADEETESRGMQQVLYQVGADGAIVTEATELDVCIAHKGFCWIEIRTRGVAAHGSRYMEGVDANVHMGHVLNEIGLYATELLQRPAHPLVGPPSVHAPLIKGGSGISTYSAECTLHIERRTIGGETEDDVMREINQIVARVRERIPDLDCTVRSLLFRPPLETSPDAPIVRAVHAAAATVREQDPAFIGHSYWMDAALISAAGIETVVIGPAGKGAHADEEYVELESVVALADILCGAAIEYCRDGRPSVS